MCTGGRQLAGGLAQGLGASVVDQAQVRAAAAGLSDGADSAPTDVLAL